MQAKSQRTFNSLLGSSDGNAKASANSLQTTTTNQTNLIIAGQRLPFPTTNTTAAAATNSMSPLQRQMEENKLKYIVQQKQLMATPTLSIQKANLIKAKLGLTVNTKSNNSNNWQSTAASNNNVLTADLTNANDLNNADKIKLLQSKANFECTNKPPGLYADVKLGCAVWYICSKDNRKFSFLCPTGTIFDVKLGICNWRFNVPKCENALPF